MRPSFSWRSEIGRNRTDDNRDMCGIGERGDDALCIVLDGSTNGRDSGVLARAIACRMIDGFMDAPDPITLEAITGIMKAIHGPLAREYPQASASYMMVWLQESGMTVIHAGDCLFGRREGSGKVEWISRPHTLANALTDTVIEDLIANPARHRVTRSFRAREFMTPDVFEVAGETDVIVSTDGFWAELTASEQAGFLAGSQLQEDGDSDDRSVLRIRLQETPGEAPKSSNTLYVRGLGT